MSEGIFTLELGRYGLMLDTEWAYVSLSWQLLATVAIIFAGYTVYKRKKNNK